MPLVATGQRIWDGRCGGDGARQGHPRAVRWRRRRGGFAGRAFGGWWQADPSLPNGTYALRSRTLTLPPTAWMRCQVHYARAADL